MRTTTDKRYDVIVAGAGSAGCALAYRLAASTDLNVLLLEAGGADRNPLLHIPLGFAFLLKPNRYNWNYRTAPEPGLQQREVDLPRGKVLGGCSSINGMVYVRGQAEDYDRWAALGNEGWSFREVLPYFKRSEHCASGADDYHATGGPLWVGPVNTPFPICDAFIEAARQAGHALNADINGARQEGVGYFPTNIRAGRRRSAARAFLDAGRAPGNLHVLTGATVRRVLFERDRAVGVECTIGRRTQVIRADHEIALCAGAINSPKVLELSGVGQADLLRRHGIPVVLDAPEVGENLHDHWNSYLVRNIDRGANYYRESKPLPMLRNVSRYLLRRQGFLANPAALVAVFYRAMADADRPDAQIHFAPAASEVNSRGNLVPIDGVIAASCGLRPTSRGATHIRSRRDEDAPLIGVNYLQTAYDQAVAIAALRKTREIFAAEALAGYGGSEREPGNAVTSDADILDYIRRTGEPVHHLAGSCRMGRDTRAVVDQRLQVQGLRGLRIADASIMPEIVSGNTHATCVMIGEKAADEIAAAR